MFLALVFASCAREVSSDGGGANQAVKRTTLPASGEGAPALTVEIPSGFTTEEIEGPDFEIHRIRHPDDIGVLSIYLGHHPNRSPAPDLIKLRKKVGSRTVIFEKRATAYGSFADALVAKFFTGSGGDVAFLHIFINAKEEQFYEDAWRMLETLATTEGAES